MRRFLSRSLGLVTNVIWSSVEARCTNCERACPFKAIRVDVHRGVSVDGGRCKGCGRCEAVCRANVLKVFPKDKEGDFSNSCEHSTPYANDMMERFLAIVR